MTRRALWLVEAGLLIILSIPFIVLPLGFSMKVGELLGLLLFYAWGNRRKIAIENMRNSQLSRAIVVSEPVEKIIRDSFKNFGRSLIEVIKIYYGSGKKIIDSVNFEGVEHFNHAQSKGKGILLLTGHCGNWELLAIMASVRTSPISIVARPINNPYINKIVEGARKKYGNTVIYKQGALKSIITTLRDNGCVGILMDQAVIPDEGYVIDFLGRGAWTTKMLALIARKTGAAVVPAFIHRTDNGHKIKIYPEAELSESDEKETALREDMKKFSGFIEDYIREHPSEWLWIHRRWKRVNENIS